MDYQSEIDDFDREEYLEKLTATLEQYELLITELQPEFQEHSKNVHFAKDNMLFFSDADATEKTAITVNTDYHCVGAYGRFAIVVYYMGKSCAFGLFDQDIQVCLIMSEFEITQLFWPDENQFGLHERYDQATRLVEELDKLMKKVSSTDAT